MSFTAQGTSGALRCGGRVAASLTRWSFTPSGGSWRVTATVGERDSFLLESDYPKELRLDLASTTWRFRKVSASVDAATITGEGEPEEL